MTEQEWQRCREPGQMLAHLRGKVSDRKVRLFACACCRKIWHLIDEEPARKVVEVAEQFADGTATLDHLAASVAEAAAACRRGPYFQQNAASRTAIWLAANLGDPEACQRWAWAHRRDWAVFSWAYAGDFQDVFAYAASIARAAARAGASPRPRRPLGDAGDVGQKKQAILLRDICGPVPYHPLPALRPFWLMSNESTVRKLADAIYERRRFEDLSVLADALEDAGCTEEAILAHLRGPGPHVRGCWVLDQLLGKE